MAFKSLKPFTMGENSFKKEKLNKKVRINLALG